MMMRLLVCNVCECMSVRLSVSHLSAAVSEAGGGCGLGSGGLL